jgi:predicted nucleic acid-binding protein
MQSATLDTSCALNFLTIEEDPDNDLMEVISLALAGRVAVNVSEEAFAEVELTADAAARAKRIARLEAFGRLSLPQHREAEREQLAAELHGAIFPDAQSGSKKDEHNWRDCRQLATHKLIGRDSFISRDERLLRGAVAAKEAGIDLISPKQLVDQVAAQMKAAGLPSYPGVSVRDAQLEEDESDIREVLAPLAADYPNFDEWLTKALSRPETRVRLGEYDDRVAAVALSQGKGRGS